MMYIPRIIIAAPWSCAGKTTVATGLMGAFKRQGLKVQPFKVGPDFIDTSHHCTITGKKSRNLDKVNPLILPDFPSLLSIVFKLGTVETVPGKILPS